MILSRIGIAALLLLTPLAACGARTPAAPSGEAAGLLPVSIRTAKATRLFNVEVARSSEEQAQGLMHRTSLPADGGMLFPFVPARAASFWMKNTLIPLDMIFIRPDGTIARIAANTTPHSLDLVESGEPVAAVLEIAGGGAAAAGIAEGDAVSWPGGPGAR